MGDFPLMTDAGTFINNGAERVIVAGSIRSPRRLLRRRYDKTGKKLYAATINPNRGAWLEYETDSNDVFYVCTSIRTASCPLPCCCVLWAWAATPR